MKRHHVNGLLLLLAVLGSTARSDDRVAISGFMTIGGGFTDADAYPNATGNDPSDPDLVGNSNQNNALHAAPRYSAGAGRFVLSDRFNFNSDTRAGIQFDYTVNDQTSAVMQIVAKGKVDNFAPDLSWLYLSHQWKPDLSVRAGRFRMPIYLVSDYLDVGIAYPWIRPPVEVYTLINMENLTGVDALYSQRVGSWVWNLQPYAGSSDFKRGDFLSEFRNLIGFNTSLGNDNLSVRLAYVQYQFSARLDATSTQNFANLLNTLRGAGFSDAADYLNINGTTSHFFSTGITANYGGFKLMSEAGARRGEKYVPDANGYYATVGYTMGDYFPHLTYARRDQPSQDERYPARISQMPGGLQAAVRGFVNNGVGIEDNESQSWTLGLKYQLSSTVVGKMEVSEVENLRSTGLFEYSTADTKNHIYSIALDAVF